jgi:hypothetical protein
MISACAAVYLRNFSRLNIETFLSKTIIYFNYTALSLNTNFETLCFVRHLGIPKELLISQDLRDLQRVLQN